MEQIKKTVHVLNDSGRWDYHYHQRIFSNLQSQFNVAPFPTSRVDEITEHVIDGTHFTPEYTDESGVLFLMARNVKPFEISLDSVSYITPEEHQKIIRCKPEPGDVLVTKDGTIDVASVVPDFLPEFNIFVSLIKLRPKPIISPHYLVTFLNSDLGQMQIQQQTKGASITHIHLEDMRRLRIPIPPRPIQDRIAQIMQDAYAERRAKLAEAQALLDGIDGWVFEKLQIDFRHIASPKYFNVSGMKMNSSRWDVLYHTPVNPEFLNNKKWCMFESYASVIRDTVTPSRKPQDSFYHIAIQGMNNNPYSAEDKAQDLLGEELQGLCKRFKGGDVLFARLGPTIVNRKSALVSRKISDGVCSPEFLVVRPKHDSDGRFILWLLKSELLVQQMLTKTTGATPSRARLHADDLLALHVPKVDIEQQQAIGRELEQRRERSIRLISEADLLMINAKQQVESMILGE
ncbi:MAG: restriction endonuclease subunit S [Caldilineaceae bacterium]